MCAVVDSRHPHEPGQIQRQYRIRLHTKLQDSTKYVFNLHHTALGRRAPPVPLVSNVDPLTDCFTKHGIDRTVPVESLVKCKMQDNLEFLQWSKRFWDQYFPGHDYDAVARRKGAGVPAAAAAPAAARSSTGTSTTRKPGTTPVNRVAPRAAGVSTATTAALKAENEQLKEAIAGLEKERDFYFSKLRDIELLLQTAVEQDPALEEDENGLVKNIQAILYSTEEGFEIPDLDANGAEEPETF